MALLSRHYSITYARQCGIVNYSMQCGLYKQVYGAFADSVVLLCLYSQMSKSLSLITDLCEC